MATRLVFFLLGIALASTSLAREPDWTGVEKEALTHLVELIKLDTSQPAGNEIIAAQYLENVLKREGIESRIFESAPNRATLVARLKGNGTSRPLLLLGHTDVVTVERENWSFEPFSGTVADGKIFGRGAADDKGIVAGSLQVMLTIKRMNIELDRDLIFMGVADEEAGGMLGITYMIENHLEEISAEFAINEGGRAYIDPITGDFTTFSIGTAEKTPRRARLVARGRAGHGSVPTRDNAIGVLANAVSNLYNTPLPMALNETTQTFFERLAQTRPEAEAAVYRAILAPSPSLEDQQKLQEINPAYYSIIRTSVVPTIFNGGYQRNVIPSNAEATLDIRALPGVDPEEMFQQIASIANESSIEIIPMRVTRPAHDPAPLNSALFRAFDKVIVERHSSAVVLPSMLTGATDSAQLRAAGIHAYGFGPGGFSNENNGVHGNDEFLRLVAFNEYLKILWHVVIDVAATKGN